MAKLYATHFTEQELKDILAFYKSPVGKKLLAQQPNVVEASMKFAQDWANKLSDEVISEDARRTEEERACPLIGGVRIAVRRGCGEQGDSG